MMERVNIFNKLITKVKYLAVLVCLILFFLVVLPSSAQSGGNYSLFWWTIDGGGGSASNGSITLYSTIGQPDAGAPMEGGNYTLQGGFWGIKGIGVAAEWKVYLPLVIE